MRELIRGRRRLPTSATAFLTCGPKPELSTPRRDGGRDLLPFLNVPRCLPCGSGGHVASRATPAGWDPGAGSSCFRRFARPRCPTERATFVGLRRRSVVTIGVHGSLDRVKDASLPRGSRPLWPVHAPFCAHADGVPLLGVQRTPPVVGATVERGGDPFQRAGPT
jgi:hypothetical protein